MHTLGDFTMTIAGLPVAAESSIPVLNPATELIVANAPNATRADLDRAVEAAQVAFERWSMRTLDDRRVYLNAIADCLFESRSALAQTLTAEQGKPIAAAEREILTAIHWFRELSRVQLPPEDLDGFAGESVRVRRVPVGVVGAIVPWNFPITLAAWKIAPALLAGNTIVVKPSPFTPLTTLRMGELLRGVLPPGVLNVISGGDQVGPWMSAHPGIAKIAFTGSTATGRAVMANAAGTLKLLTLELGGNDPAIVMPDVDVAQVASQIFWGAFLNSGQVCVAAKRVYVHESIYARMADALVELAESVKVGPGTDVGCQLGPVQNKRQYDRLLSLLDDCRRRGYTFLTGGHVPEGPGYFIPPTLVDNPPHDSRVVAEEAFGPLLPLLKFSGVDEVIALANASEYGLAASVWSRDEALAMQIAERLEAGTVWINEIHTMSPLKPMAGHKQSGIGVENGIDGYLAYTRPQTISVARNASDR